MGTFERLSDVFTLIKNAKSKRFSMVCTGSSGSTEKEKERKEKKKKNKKKHK